MLKIKTLKGFADLCLPLESFKKEEELINILREMESIGYRNVALEQIYKHETISSKGADQIPNPKCLASLKEMFRNLNLFNRLTVIYSDTSVTHTLARSQNFKKFHIVAALPTTESSLQHACQTFQGDIITYNMNTNRNRLNRKFYYLAVRRNLFFELKYSPVIANSNDRRATITRAQQYRMSGKSKNIIISSEATSVKDIRSPYEIFSLGLIFGLSEEQAKSAISSQTQNVLLAAESRRLGRTPVLSKYEDLDTSTSEEDENDDAVNVKKRTGGFQGNDSKRMKLT